jgi:hypothetical protein
MEASLRWQIEGAVNDFFTAPFWYTYMAKNGACRRRAGHPLLYFIIKIYNPYYKNTKI